MPRKFEKGENHMNEKISAYSKAMTELCIKNDSISDNLFKDYGVYRGLRDINGKGVLTGLTNISEVTSFKEVDGERIPIDGELWYRGYRIQNLISNLGPDEFGFEKTAYLLIFGELPSKDELANFKDLLGECMRLPTNFTRDVIMKASTKDIMNSMTRSILTLSSYEENTSSGKLEDSLRQRLQLISVFPMLAVYGYHA
jgi:citrate synthase